jgi:AcrR family transcriptional regulator
MPVSETSDTHRGLRSDARRNRERILRTAWHMLTQGGVERFEMDDLAREVGISKGTLYRHFTGRDELFRALVEDAAEHVVETLRTEIAPEADAVTKLRSFVDILYRSYDEADVSLELMLALHALHRGDEVSKFVEIPERLHNILLQGRREGMFRAIDVDYMTVAVLSMINPVAVARAQQRLGYATERLRNLTFDTICHALGVEPAPHITQESETSS